MTPDARPSAPAHPASPDATRPSSPQATRTSSLDPTRAQLWQAARGPVLVGGIVLAAALVLAVLTGRPQAGALDPRAIDRVGSRAVAEVLRDQGVRVDLVETTDAAVAALAAEDRGATGARGPDGSGPATSQTLLVALPGRLAPSQLDRLRAAAPGRVVLVEPTPEALAALAPGVQRLGSARSRRAEPACDLAAAQRAGEADVGETVYGADPGAGATVVVCYRGSVEDDGTRREAAPLVQVRYADAPGPRPRTVTVLGDAAPLSNDRLDDQGNAALALGLLGATPRLIWYLPSRDDVPLSDAATARSALSLVPDGVRYGGVMLAVAVALLALWRGRRLGPVVAEPLPVVVRSAETTEGRARLYRRVRARDRAADALREAARERLRGVLGLPRAAGSVAIVNAVAARTGRSTPDLGDLLYGAAPGDDAALVGLAAQLDDLQREVRRP